MAQRKHYGPTPRTGLSQGTVDLLVALTGMIVVGGSLVWVAYMDYAASMAQFQ